MMHRNPTLELTNASEGLVSLKSLISMVILIWFAVSTPARNSSFVNRRIYDISLLGTTAAMLLWPWIFLGVVCHANGIQMSDHIARLVTENPQIPNFFVPLVGNLVGLVIAILFSFSVIRFAQEWVAVSDEVTVFHISLLSAFRYQYWPWGIKDMKEIVKHTKWLIPVVLVAACLGTLALVPSGITSLLAPVPFNRTVALNGTEINFSSLASDCVEFLNKNAISNNCDWRVSSMHPDP